MKVLAIILNIFVPGLGSRIGGRVGAGLMQLMLLFICIVLNFTVVGTIIGVPLAIVNWIWAIVTAASLRPAAVAVEVTVKDAGALTTAVEPPVTKESAELQFPPIAPVVPPPPQAPQAAPLATTAAVASTSAAAQPGMGIPAVAALVLGALSLGAGGVYLWLRQQPAMRERLAAPP